MKFRFVLVGPEDDPEGARPSQGSTARAPRSLRRALRYEQKGSDTVRVETQGNGIEKSTAVANFTARIVRDLILDDGEEQRREFELEANLGEQKVGFSLPVAEFSRMGWVLNKLGSQAIIYPGQQQHARAAIQWLSGQIRQERIFAHLGWRRHDSHWVYLHA